ncbi:MAG: ABC transporter ATP-binding protein [Alphaproteobacteria bacterium]|nr:ABC transporter ATP-binding protein [Alphaproteobacteria bacterium]
MSAILATEGLSKRFGGVIAIDDLGFAVQEGELHCLIGPNGAGKSTLFKLIVGRLRPSSGSVRFRGDDITHLPSPARIRAGISIKMQVPGIFPELPVEQNLAIALQSRFDRAGVRREMERLLDFVGLAGEVGKPAGQLAHGQKQWLEIAMAIGLRPSLLCLDEPTAGLSPEETRKTGEMVLGLQREGMTILVVEHDMTFVRQLAGHVTVLHFGRLFAQGTIDEIIVNEAVQEIYLGKGRHGH